MDMTSLSREEILVSKNALLVCCVNLEYSDKNEVDKVSKFLAEDDGSELMNYLNSGVSGIEGLGSFITGLRVAKNWGLGVQYERDSEIGSIQTGYGMMQNQPIYG